MRKGEDDHGRKLLKTVGMVLLSAAGGITVGLIVLMLGAGMISAEWLGEEGELAVAVVAAALGGMFAGGFAAANIDGKRIVTALTAAGCMILGLFTTGILIYQEPGMVENWLPVALGCLCGGALAGVFRPRKKKKRRK